jgi:phenylalanyl-tRNA synthetase beta chain
MAQVEKLLRALGLGTQRLARGRALAVTVPARRPDLSREADLIEEVARLHGYDQMPTTAPMLRSSGDTGDDRLSWERKLRAFLAGASFVEVINLPFVGSQDNRDFKGLFDAGTAPVKLLNPLDKERSELRHSLVPGLIEDLRHNLAQKSGGFFGYQLGKVFYAAASGGSDEQFNLAGVLHGPRPRQGLGRAEFPATGFFDCKGVVEGICDLFGVLPGVAWRRSDTASLHPGRSADLVHHGVLLGRLGELHPSHAERLEVPSIYIFELDFEKLLQYAPRRITVRGLPRLPAVERDLAIVVDNDFAAQQIVDWVAGLGQSLIESVQVFDQYVGASIAEGKKSLAYKISYRSDERTLTDAEVNQMHQDLVDRLGNHFGVERRS